MIQSSRYAHPSRSDVPRSHDREGMQSSRPIIDWQEKAVEDITANIMAIFEHRIRMILDETAPQIKVAVRQAFNDRDRALSRAASTYVGATPPAVSDDMPEALLVPKKTSPRVSASKGKKIAVAVVCSPKPQLSARHYQLAGSLTKQNRTRRCSKSSTATSSSSEIDVQPSRSMPVVKIEENCDEECFCGQNSDFDMKEIPDSDDEDSSSTDEDSSLNSEDSSSDSGESSPNSEDGSSNSEDSSSDSDYVDVADEVDAVTERSAGFIRTGNAPARASRSQRMSSRGSLGETHVNTVQAQHRQPARSSPSTASYVGSSARKSSTAARTCHASSGSSRKRTREDEEPEYQYPCEDPLRKDKLVGKGKALGFR